MDKYKRETRPAAVSIGRRLKEAREEKSLTIDEIQKQTRIHSSVLMALEEGRASELLTDTYVRSFLKKYAQLLGLPALDMLKEYFPPHPESSALNIPANEKPLPKEMRIEPKILYFTGMAILGIAALFIVLAAGGKIITAFNKTKAAVRQSQASRAAIVRKKEHRSARSAPKKKTTVKTTTEQKEIAAKSTPLNLVISVKEPVLVKLKKDGVVQFSRILPKNLVETITANESIELDIGKTRAVELTLDGRPVTLPAKNNISGLIITRKGVKLK